jgi:hypothetical protein
MKMTRTQASGTGFVASPAWTCLLTGLVLGVFIVLRTPAPAGAGSTLPGLSVSLSPAQGPAGSVVTVTGKGYQGCRDHGDRTVKLLWDGSRTGVSAPVQDDGTFSATITVGAPGGASSHLVFGACTNGANWASATFTVAKPLAQESGGSPG